MYVPPEDFHILPHCTGEHHNAGDKHPKKALDKKIISI